MTTLTLDQAKTIIFSAVSSPDAASKLKQAGFDVTKSHASYIYIVDLGGDDHISFSSVSKTCDHLHVVVCGEYVTTEFRKAFLESQQQPTDTVPAVSTVAEARPESGTDFCQDLMGFFAIFGKVANFDESWQRTFYENLLSNPYIPVASPFDASLRLVLTVISDTHDQLSTRPVDDTDTELNCFCPTCDYHSATAVMCDPDDPFYHVTCSQCGLDADRQNVWLSPSGLPAHQAELSTESVDKVGE